MLRHTDRYLLRHSAACTARIGGVLVPFLLLGGLGSVFQRSNDLLGLRPGLAVAAGLVIAAPYLFVLSALFGAAWFYARAAFEQEPLLLAQAGIGPWRMLAMPLVVAAILSGSSLVLAWNGSPRVAAAMENLHWLEGDDLARVATSLAGTPTRSSGLLVGARDGDTPSQVRDLRLFQLKRGLGLAADRARITRKPGEDAQLEAMDGAVQGLLGNSSTVHFDGLRGPLDLEGFAPKKRWGLWSARSRPLSKLPRELAELRAIPGQEAAAGRYAYELFFRLALALMPLLATLSLALSLASPNAAHPPRACFSAAFAVASGLGLGLVSSRQALEGGLGLSIAVLLLGATLPTLGNRFWLRRSRRRGDRP